MEIMHETEVQDPEKRRTASIGLDASEDTMLRILSVLSTSPMMLHQDSQVNMIFHGLA